MDNGAIKLKDKIKLRIELLENDPFLFTRDDLFLLREVFDELGNIKDKINAKIDNLLDRVDALGRGVYRGGPTEIEARILEGQVGILRELLEEL